MKDIRIKYPNKLLEIRKSKGLKQADISQALGLASEDRICRWEKGIAVPHLINLLKLCILYNAKVEDLYPELPEMKNPFKLDYS